MSQERASPEPGPGISVVVTTYQRRAYAQRAVDSVLAQTNEDFEVIVVDDGSTDGTDRAFAEVDSRVRYVWQENRGVSAACNEGIRLARAPIVAFLDSDDRWRPGHLAVVAEMFSRYPETILLCTRPRFLFSSRSRRRDARLVDALPLLLVENFVGPRSSVAIRKSALVTAEGFDEALSASEGRDLWLRLASQGPFCLVDSRTTIIQVTERSLTTEGRASSAHVPVDELIAKRIAGDVARLDRPDAPELAARAVGRQQYVTALRGLVSHDDEAVTRGLGEACKLLPELSREAYLVARRMQFIAASRSERLHHLATAAACWPEPCSDTAMYLRGNAILLALRMGRPRTAARLAAGWQLRPTPGFLSRTYPLWWQLARTTLGSWTRLSRDTVYER